MDSIFEISKLVGFEHPEEIVKTLEIIREKCESDLDNVLKSPVLPPLSYTNDCMRFVTLIRYWRGKEIAKECAKAYRVVRDPKGRDEFWWSVQELFYRAKADSEVVRKFLRRIRREYRKVMRARKRIEDIIEDWVLPPYVELFSGLLPPRKAVRVVKFALDSLIEKSDHFSRFNVSVFDLAFKLFEFLYRIALANMTPKEKFEKMVEFVKFFLGIVEISLVSRKDSVYPPLDLTFWKDSH